VKVLAIIFGCLISQTHPKCLVHIYGTTLTPLDFPTQVLSRLKHACKYGYCGQFATQITMLDAQAVSTHSQELFPMGISYCSSHF